MDHKGRDAVGEPLVDHEVPGVGQHGLVEPGDVAHQVVEPAAGYPAGGVQVDAVEPLHDIGMIRHLELRHRRRTEPLHLHVGGIVGPDGHGGVDHIGDHQQDLMDFGSVLALQLFQLGQPVGPRLDLGLDFFGLGQLGGILFGLAHEHTDFFTQSVAGGPQLAGLGDGRAVFGVQVQDLVHQGEFFLLELIDNILFDCVGVVSDKTDI